MLRAELRVEEEEEEERHGSFLAKRPRILFELDSYEF